MNPNDASKKPNNKEVYTNLRDDREKQTADFHLRQLLRTADFKNVFSKGDSTNWFYDLYTITEVIHDTFLSYRINYLTERYNQYFLLPSKLCLEEKDQGMKKLNLIQKYIKY